MPLLDTISSNTLDDSNSDEDVTMLDVSSRALSTLLQASNDKPFNNAKDYCHVACSKLIRYVSVLISM